MNRLHFPVLAGATVLIALGLSAAAYAKNNSTITRIGNNIVVGPSDEVADVTCVGCNIRIRGLVSGDVTTVGGSVALEDQAQVAGDVTSVGGNLRLEKSVKVAGDVTVIGGTIDRAPGASIAGDVTGLGGRGWMLLVFLAPLFVLALLIALIVWLVQRARRPAIPATAA
jgi:hypothetical protein